MEKALWILISPSLVIYRTALSHNMRQGSEPQLPAPQTKVNNQNTLQPFHADEIIMSFTFSIQHFILN